MDNHFQRVEEKYLLTNKEKEILLHKIGKYIEKDKYFASEIHNIYFDSANDDLIINSLDKPIFKDKFRLRSYGIPKGEDNVYLEVKTKYNGVVGKRRVKMTLNEFNNYLNNKDINNNKQIFKEIDYYFKYYKLKPTIYIAYDRHSYVGLDNSNLRITFDTNLRSRRDHLKIEDNSPTISYFKKKYYIMEIKTVGSMPLWLVRTLSDMHIIPINFSKYGKIYTREKIKESENYA